MPKYINAEGLLNSGRDFLAGVLFVEKGRREGKTKAMLEELLRHVIRTAPAEDVEPVVRCKDCARRMVKIESPEVRWWCKACGFRCNDDDWFCPVGRRKTNV